MNFFGGNNVLDKNFLNKTDKKFSNKIKNLDNNETKNIKEENKKENNKTEKNSHAGHRERLREKFNNNGLDAFKSEEELLEFFLTYSLTRQDTKKVARELLKVYDNVETILKLENQEEFLKKTKHIKGIGKQTFIFFKMVNHVSKRLYNNFLENNNFINIKSKDILLKYLRQNISHEKIEKFYVGYLDSSNQLIKFEEEATGTIDRAIVHSREILKKVIKYDAKSVFLVHNHPSGKTDPSESDIKLTRHIQDVLRNINVYVIEHIIISNYSYYSFAEQGII